MCTLCRCFMLRKNTLHFVPKTPFYQLEPTNKTGCFCKKILAANFDNKYYTTPVSNVLLLYKGIWQLKPGKKIKLANNEQSICVGWSCPSFLVIFSSNAIKR